MAGTVRNVYIIQTKSAYIIMTQKHRATIATTTQGRHSRKGERIAENYLETRNKVIENCWRMIVGTAIAQHKQPIPAGAKVKITGKLQNLYGDFLTVEYNGTRYTVDPRKIKMQG